MGKIYRKMDYALKINWKIWGTQTNVSEHLC